VSESCEYATSIPAPPCVLHAELLAAHADIQAYRDALGYGYDTEYPAKLVDGSVPVNHEALAFSKEWHRAQAVADTLRAQLAAVQVVAASERSSSDAPCEMTHMEASAWYQGYETLRERLTAALAQPKGATTCNRTACQVPLPTPPRWWNTSTRAYYCDDCKRAITRFPENVGIFEDRAREAP
jgi:hypothetical protein